MSAEAIRIGARRIEAPIDRNGRDFWKRDAESCKVSVEVIRAIAPTELNDGDGLASTSCIDREVI